MAFETRPESELLRAQTSVSLFQLQKRQFDSQKHFREQDSAEVKSFRLLVTVMSFPEKSIPSSRVPPQSCGVVVVDITWVPAANVTNQLFVCNFVDAACFIKKIHLFVFPISALRQQGSPVVVTSVVDVESVVAVVVEMAVVDTGVVEITGVVLDIAVAEVI